MNGCRIWKVKVLGSLLLAGAPVDITYNKACERPEAVKNGHRTWE